MTTIYVQFSDSTDAEIVSYFQAEQPTAEGDSRVLGTVETSDSKWKTYFETQPVQVQPFLPAPD